MLELVDMALVGGVLGVAAAYVVMKLRPGRPKACGGCALAAARPDLVRLGRQRLAPARPRP